MRDILFRGKTLNGEWVHGMLSRPTIKIGQVEPGYYISNSVGCPFAYAARPETIGQFTGLKDKNGTEIFEGDIIRYESRKHGSRSETPDFTFFYEIRFTQLRWCCHGCGYFKDMAQVVTLNNDGCIARSIEVIGNIHDNPELLRS